MARVTSTLNKPQHGRRARLGLSNLGKILNICEYKARVSYASADSYLKHEEVTGITLVTHPFSSVKFKMKNIQTPGNADR